MDAFLEQIKKFYGKLTQKQKIIIGLVAAVGFLSLIFLIYLKKDNMVVIYRKLPLKDARKIVTQLEENNITHKYTDGNIYVKAEETDKVQMLLASANALPESSTSWNDLFDNNSNIFGTTDKIQDLNIIRGLQGRIEKMIVGLEDVETCKVAIVQAEKKPWEDEQEKTTASIIVGLTDFGSLNQGQVRGILNIVAHSVKGLKPENITLLDASGTNLAENLPERQDKDFASNNKQLEFKRAVEKEKNTKTRQFLDSIYGAEYVNVKVSAELDFTKKAVTSSEVKPLPGEDQGIRISEKNSTETYVGKGVRPVGVPGTDTNNPGYKEIDRDKNEYAKTDSIINYDVTRIKEIMEFSPGAISKLTVAVAIDSNCPQVKGREPKAVIAEVSEMVKGAIGFDDNRGDNVVVSVLPFNREKIERYNEEMKKRDQEKRLKNMAIIVLLALACVGGPLAWKAYTVLLKKRELRKRQEDERKRLMASRQVTAPVMTVEEQKKYNLHERIKSRAMSKPADVAQIIKVWIGTA